MGNGKESVTLSRLLSQVVFFGPNNVEYYNVIYEGQKWLARPLDCYDVATEVLK